MSRRSSNGSEERFGGGNVWAVYVDAFANRGMTLRTAKAVLEQFHLKEEHYLVLPSLEVQDSDLDAPGSVRSLGYDFDADADDHFVGPILDDENDWDLKGAAAKSENDKRTAGRRLSKLQEFCWYKKKSSGERARSV